MEIRHLRYFQVVSRLNSITKAAAELHISQPSLTVAIQTLEEELGVSLFERYHRHISLAPVGLVFLNHVDDILLRVDNSLSEMRDYRTQQTRSIKIGIPPMSGVFLFPHIFGNFRSLYPDLELKIVEAGTLSILRLLEQDKLDIGFMALCDKLAGIKTLPVVDSEIKLCLSPSHPFGEWPKVPIAALRDQSFILLKEDTYNRRIVLEECKKNEYTPNIIFSTRQIQTIINLVEQGVGISFLLDVVAAKQPTIISRPLASPLLLRTGLAWREDKYPSRALKDFIAFIEAAFSVKRCEQADN
jgi:DNA-binding transcriptional LysR family regulator